MRRVDSLFSRIGARDVLQGGRDIACGPGMPSLVTINDELLARQDQIDSLVRQVSALERKLNVPELIDFANGVRQEAAHQRERWGSEHDAGKTAADWFWLLGYLAGKAIQADKVGDVDKLRHHIITTAAACANWHLHTMGLSNMRPGIMPPEGER